MPVYSIPIHGLIGSPESPEDKQTYFQFSDLLLHINKAQAFDVIELDIASDGGYVDVADKMIEVLQSTKKPIISKNSGNVASAASKIFTLAPKGSRSFDPSKGVFLIHNPFGAIEGDASELALASKALQDTENNYAKWYANATGADITVIKAFMSENIPLTSEQIETLGFAVIVKPAINAVAKLKSNNHMSTLKEQEEKLTAFEKFIDKIMSKFHPKAIMIADANGKELEFPELTDPSEIKVGVKVSEDGKPANGEYPQADGSVFVCKDGVLAEIKPKAADDTQALKAENEKLKAEIEALKASKATTEASATEAIKAVTEVKAEFKKFKALFSNGKPDDANPPAGGAGDNTNTNRKPFKTKE
jgi:ATP-dependent protease ClpP protease subunit